MNNNRVMSGVRESLSSIMWWSDPDFDEYLCMLWDMQDKIKIVPTNAYFEIQWKDIYLHCVSEHMGIPTLRFGFEPIEQTGSVLKLEQYNVRDYYPMAAILERKDEIPAIKERVLGCENEVSTILEQGILQKKFSGLSSHTYTGHWAKRTRIFF